MHSILSLEEIHVLIDFVTYGIELQLFMIVTYFHGEVLNA